MIRSGSTLGELLSDAKIAPVAKDAIRGRDLKREDVWSMPLARLREGYFASDLEAGFEAVRKL